MFFGLSPLAAERGIKAVAMGQVEGVYLAVYSGEEGKYDVVSVYT